MPADAEVVIEGIIEANKRYAEGPFGEYPLHSGGQIVNPQLKVTAITHRKDAIWYNIAAGWADHNGTGGPRLGGVPSAENAEREQAAVALLQSSADDRAWRLDACELSDRTAALAV